MNKITFFAAAVFLCVLSCAVAYADTIVLNDGTVIEGAITEQTDEYVRIDSSGTDMLFDNDEVESADYESSERVPAASEEQKLEEKLRILMAVGGVMGVVLFFVWIYSSLCLMFIARKTNTEPAWLAWVPVANIFLLAKIARVNYWWAGGAVLTGMIPYLGLFVSLGIAAYMWYKVAIARGRPGWFGALVIIPLVNFVVMGMLAFSDDGGEVKPQGLPS